MPVLEPPLAGVVSVAGVVVVAAAGVDVAGVVSAVLGVVVDAAEDSGVDSAGV